MVWENKVSEEDVLLAIELMNSCYATATFMGKSEQYIDLRAVQNKLEAQGKDIFGIFVELYENPYEYDRDWRWASLSVLHHRIWMGEHRDDQIRKYWEIVEKAGFEDWDDFTEGINAIAGARGNGLTMLQKLASEMIEKKKPRDWQALAFSMAAAILARNPEILMAEFVDKLETVASVPENEVREKQLREMVSSLREALVGK